MTGLDVGRAHRLALLLTIVLPTLGVVSGSARLAVAGLLLMVASAASAPFLLREQRPRRLHVLVHALTFFVLVFAVATIRAARIDSVLIIVMAGIFDRVSLRSGARDDFIIVAAASVLMTMATTITPGVAFLPLVLGFVPAVSWTLLTSTILAQARTRRELDGFAREPLPRLRAALGLTGVLFMIVGYAGLSFLPRYNFSRTFSVGAFAAFAGADRTMTLGLGGVDARGDGSVVIRVTPSEGASPEALRGLYARVFALDRFDGTTWEASDPYPAPPWPRSGSPGFDDRARVAVRRLVSRSEPHPVPLFGAREPSAVRLRRPRESAGGTVYSQIPQATLRFEYATALGSASPPLRPPEPGQFLELPPTLSPRVRRLARELVGSKRGFEAVTTAILAHFEQGFSYSVQQLPGSAEDPLERFLFEAKRGHCELYAGAVAALLRAVGVPARVVTGYYGGWWNAAAGQLEYVGEDAHAWVEAWNPRTGWMWLDATPPDLRTARQGKPLAWIRDLYDWAEGVWYGYVVDFDEKRRRRMLTRIGEAFEAGWSSVVSTPIRAARTGKGGTLGMLLVVATLGAGLVAVWLRRRTTAVGRLGSRLRRALGIETSTTLRRGVASVPASVRAEAARAVGAYEALRFGGEADRPALGEVEAAVRALESKRRQRSTRVEPDT